jgi:hypothetical protein
MSKPQTSRKLKVNRDSRSPVEVIPRAYAGKWIAWSEDGRRIIAVGATLKSCEQAAARSGFAPELIAIERVPTSRARLTGSGM